MAKLVTSCQCRGSGERRSPTPDQAAYRKLPV